MESEPSLPGTDWKLFSQAWLDYTTASKLAVKATHRIPPQDAAASGMGGQAKALPGVEILCSAGKSELVVERFFECLQAQLAGSALPEFWGQLRFYCTAGGEWPGGGEEGVGDLQASLLAALQGLVARVEQQAAALAVLNSQISHVDRGAVASIPCITKGMLARHQRLVTGLILATSEGLSLPDMLRRVYEHKLSELSTAAREQSQQAVDADMADQDDSDDSDANVDSGAVLEPTDPMDPVCVMGSDWVDGVTGIALAMGFIGLGSLNDSVAAGVVYRHLQHHLCEAARRQFEQRLLNRACRYAHCIPLEFALLASGDELLAERRAEWISRLGFHVCNSLAELRIGEMFEIVVEYPESLPAIEDLRECLANTNNQEVFVSSFSQAIQSRLLHAGAATTDIIQQYVSTIKALRDLDPAGVLLEAVGQPIKEYLKKRKDTIRCIVTMLTDDSTEEDGGGESRESLFAELGRAGCGAGADGSDGEDGESDEAVLASSMAWEPDPVDADPTQSTRSRRILDVISMLVGIYGSKELFINEYRNMLAEKLLAKTDFDTSREIRTLELLKLRFGEANLHNCEIMLKDLADSKRISANIKKLPPRPLPARGAANSPNMGAFDATIVSPLFWPPIKDQLKLPPTVQRMADAFSDGYHSLKAPRKLVFGYQLGMAELEIQVGSAFLSYTVSALHAAIIMQFEEKKLWPAVELAEAVGVPLSLLRRKAVFWVNEGVITESRQKDNVMIYLAADQYSKDSGRRNQERVGGDDESSSAIALAEEQLQEEMMVYESFVVGMLTNHSEMRLDKIHNMLKMFAPGFDKTSEQLAAFMTKLVREEKLTCDGGVYRKSNNK